MEIKTTKTRQKTSAITVDITNKTEAEPEDVIRRMILSVNVMQDIIEKEMPKANLGYKEKSRLSFAGIRDYGIADKAFECAHFEPEFLPPELTLKTQKDFLELENIRELADEIEKLQAIVGDCMDAKGIKCLRNAKKMMGILKKQAKQNVTGAEKQYNRLLSSLEKKGD
jgi:hypothetical protein